MGHGREIDNTASDASSAQPNPALLQAIIETHGKNGDSKTAASYASINVTNRSTEDMTVNTFPNGVRYGTGDGAMMVQQPHGGKVEATKDGGFNVYDSHHKKVAEVDSNKTIHVHTKNGEYTETKDGALVFEPIGKNGDLSKLHKPGVVDNSKLENYGVSKDGSTTRFPSGIERDSRTGNVTIPSEFPNFHEDKIYDNHHKLVKAIGADGDGATLYTVDSKGFHVPTADGTITQTANGSIRFDNPAPPPEKTRTKQDIADDLKKLMEKCGAANADPLCGLELDGKF